MVAHEGKALAAQTARATAEIGDKVKAIRDATGDTASAIPAVADTLRTEVDHFLHAMSQDDDNRRRYERVPAGQLKARVTPADGQVHAATVTDISRGGAALLTDWVGDPGAPVMIAMPGAAQPIGARVVRHIAGIVVLSFRQDAQTLATVDAVMASLAGHGGLKLAA